MTPFFGPIADGYVAVTPEPAREAVYNVFDNLAYLTTMVNQFLQGKIERGFEDAGRFIINSTFGLGGLVDFAIGHRHRAQPGRLRPDPGGVGRGSGALPGTAAAGSEHVPFPARHPGRQRSRTSSPGWRAPWTTP